MATEVNCLPVCAPAPTDTLPVNPPTAVPPDGGSDVNVCLAPMQFCFTSTQTGDIEHPGRTYTVELPINPGFGLNEMLVDGTSHASGLTWQPNDPDGAAFAAALTAFIRNRVPGQPTVTINNPNAGTQVCGLAEPMTVTIGCVRLDRPAPDLISFRYNGGRDLIVNAGYNTTPPTVLQGADWPYVYREDNGGTLHCTDTANRGWETNDRGGAFELWGTNPTTNEEVTPTPRGTPVQEVAADGTNNGEQPTIWQTFVVPAAGTATIRVIHGGRDPGETHTIRLSTGDTGATGPGDIINNVTNDVPPVTNLGPNPPAPWTVLDQNVTLQPGTYTLSYATTSPVTPVRGGLFTDMQVILDAPDQSVDATNADNCVITTNETVTTTVCQFWQPTCTDGTIESWTNVATGATMTNAEFWAQVPAPSCCASEGGEGGGGTAAGGNLAHSYLVCGTVGGVQQTLARVVITDPSGGVLAQSFVGQNGAPVTPTAWQPGDCSSAAEPDEIDQYDTAPVQVCFTQPNGDVERFWMYDRVRFNNRTIAEVQRTRHWINSLTSVDSTNAPTGVPVNCEALQPLQVVRDTEQLGCVVENDVVVGRVFLTAINDGQDPDPDGFEMMLVANDGTITRPYTGAWSSCDTNDDFVQVVESEEMGCANGTPWSRRRTGFFTQDGQLITVATTFVDSAGNTQLVPPANFLLGACPPPAGPEEIDLLYTAPASICVEQPVGTFTNALTRTRATFNNTTETEIAVTQYSFNGVDWTEALPIGTIRLGACATELPPATGSADLVLTCDDVGQAEWNGNSIFPNSNFDDSVPDQLVSGPGWTTAYPITTGPDAQQGQLAVVEVEPGEIAIRAGASLLGQRIVGWDNIDMEQGQTYKMTFRINLESFGVVQWYVNGQPIGAPINGTDNTQQVEFLYTHTDNTGEYDVELRSNTGVANSIHYLDGIIFNRFVAATPDTVTPVAYTGTQRAVIDQIVRTAGCNDDTRDGLLKEILDVLGGPGQENITVVGTVEPGCANGVPITRTTTVVYDRLGNFVRSQTGYSFSDGTFTTVLPPGFTLGACTDSPRTYSTTVELVEGGVRTIPAVLVDGSELVSWSVRHRNGVVTVTSSEAVDNSFTDLITLDPGEVVNFDAGDDSRGWMADAAVIDATAGSARVTYQYRRPA